MSRIPNHKEVKFMKKFNFSKGLVIGLLTMALCLTCFGVAKVSAEDTAPAKSVAVDAQYDAVNDEVTAGSNAYVYVVKAASGNKLKAGQAATGQMASNKISIADLGIKSTAKDVFLYVCDKEVEVEETVSANLIIKGNANKVVGVIDYTQADKLDTESAVGSVKVLSAYYVDKSTKKSVDIESAKLYWSPDQEKWYLANSASKTGGRKDAKGLIVADGFRGNDLADMLEAGGTIYIKQAGVSSSEGTAQFGSKVTKVKVAKQAKAPKAKIDVAKDTIALKNGFDFALVQKNATTKEYTDILKWYTILPVLKTATISTLGDSIVGGMHDTKSTVYKPLDKKNTNAGKEVKNDGDDNYYYSYTKYAVKALSIDELFEIVDMNYATAGIDLPDDFRIAIRKSATEKKPASAFSVVELALQTEAPTVWTESNVKGQFLVASADEFTKKGLSLGEIAGFAGYTGTSKLAIATEGFDKTFKITAKAANDTSIQERDEGTAFEYAVVATADYAATGDAAIDWTTVKWKKLDPAKLKITEKLSGKYNTVKGTKKTASLKATASADISSGDAKTETDAYGRVIVKDSVVKENTKALLLIRRAGDKASGNRASKYIALYVAKEGKKYNLYSTVSNGAAADKYTVGFFKYDATKAGFIRDESIPTITGWSQKANTGVKLEALTDAEYWKITAVAESTGIATLGEKYTVADAKIDAGDSTDEVAKGEYQIANGGDADTDVESGHVDIAIREYANIKVTVFTQIDEETPVEVKAKNVVVSKGKIKDVDKTYYVGSACEIALAAPTSAPEKKGYTVTAADPAFTINGVTGVAYANGNVTVTPTSAEEAEITLTFKYTAAKDGD